MPFEKERYPKNWNEISLRIRERDGWKCKDCGLPNGAIIIRSNIDAARYVVYNAAKDWYERPDGTPIRMGEMPEEFEGKESRVVLTVHHKGAPRDDGSPGDIHDKMDCRDVNLEALCNRCHFIKDLPGHIINARASRNRRKHERVATAGQISLFGDDQP